MEKINIFQYHISATPKEKPRINLLLISEGVEIVSEDTDDDDKGIRSKKYDPDAEYSTGQKVTKSSLLLDQKFEQTTLWPKQI